MNAKEKLLEYAKNHNDKSIYTDEEFVGAMSIDGIVISRTPAVTVSAHVKREGRTLIVTETTRTTKDTLVDGRLLSEKVTETAEIFRVDL